MLDGSDAGGLDGFGSRKGEAAAGWVDRAGEIPRGIWWSGGGGWEDGTSLLKFRVGLYIYSIWVFG